MDHRTFTQIAALNIMHIMQSHRFNPVRFLNPLLLQTNIPETLSTDLSGLVILIL